MKKFFYAVVFFVLLAGTGYAATGSIQYLNRWPETSPNTIAKNGDYLYYGDGEVISVYNVSDKSNMVLEARQRIDLTTRGDYGTDDEVSSDKPAGTEGISGVFYDTGCLYVTCGNEGLQIYDATNPTNLSKVSSYFVLRGGSRVFVKDVYVSGDYAYLAYLWLTEDGYDSGIEIVDVDNESSPKYVGEGQLSQSVFEMKRAQAVVVSGNYAYVADYNNGLAVFNINDKTSPEVEAYWYGAGALDVAVADSGGTTYAYMACADAGLQIVEVDTDIFTSDLESLTAVSACQYNGTKTRTACVEVEDNKAYVGDAYIGVAVINVSTPEDVTNDSLSGAYDSDIAGVYRLGVDNGIIYAGDSVKGLQIIDADTDPASPSLLDAVAGTGTPADVDDLYIDVETSYVYTVDDDATSGGFKEGLRVLYAIISDNYISFLYKGFCPTDGEAIDVCVREKYVYVADGSDGLKIIDRDIKEDADGNLLTKRPVFPSVVGSGNIDDANSDGTTFANSVFVKGNYAYVTAGADGLQIFDVSSPETHNLSPVGKIFGSDVSDAKGVYVAEHKEHGDIAFVADGKNGLKTVDASDKATPVLKGTLDIPDSDDLGSEKGDVHDVHLAGNIAYLAADNEGLRGIDVSDPFNPKDFNNNYNADPYKTAVGVYAAQSDEDPSVNLIWLACGMSEGSMGFFTDPGAVPPQSVKYYTSVGDTKDVMVVSDFAYLADSVNGLQALQVTSTEEGEPGAWYYQVEESDMYEDTDSGHGHGNSSGCFIKTVFSVF